MEDFFNVRTVEEARATLVSAWAKARSASSLPPLPHEEVDLLSALGRVLAKDVISTENIPSHPRSTVDGYAVLAKDTHGATEALPAMLKVVEDIAMGAMPERALSGGQASRIPTGGMLPKGADACVMVEYTELLEQDTVLAVRPTASGENVVQQGEDVGAGDVVLTAGKPLTPFDLGALAALGYPAVPVVQKPRIAVISTGDEIVPPGEKPMPGQIRDINSYSLSGALRASGAEPVLWGVAKDTYESLRDLVLSGLSSCDAVVLSGGSSVGARDVAVKVLDDLGPPGVLVHGVALKPGKPVVLALCGGKPVFGLPGHPVSALVGLDLFARYMLNMMIAASAGGLDAVPGLTSAQETHVLARLGRNVSSAPGREDHVRVRLVEKGGSLVAEPVLGKSGLLSTMVRSDGEIVVPIDSEGLIEGTLVKVRLPRF